MNGHRRHTKTPPPFADRQSVSIHHHLRCRHLIARHWHIRRHFHHTARSAADVFIAFNIAIIRIQEPERGPGTEPGATFDAPDREPRASRRIIDREGGAIESVRRSGFDRLQIQRHPARVREGELALSTGSFRLAFHHETVWRILDRPHRLSARRRTVRRVQAPLTAEQFQQRASSGTRRNGNDRDRRWRFSRRHDRRCHRIGGSRRRRHRWECRRMLGQSAGCVHVAHHRQKNQCRCHGLHHDGRSNAEKEIGLEMNVWFAEETRE